MTEPSADREAREVFDPGPGRDGAVPEARATTAGRLLRRLREDGPLIAAELRPPRSGLSRGDAMDLWIDLEHSVRRLATLDTIVMLTDNAVGQAEEENLQHVATNLSAALDPARILPFLTCKHPLDYCLMYATRARAVGIQALTVVGGDRGAGPERCVPHGNGLRRILRSQIPTLALGGWANPHRDPAEQVGFLVGDDFEADFCLTQIVSHHDLSAVERFVEETVRRGVDVPIVAGAFYYRNGNRESLERLGRFFPVPVDGIAREFEAGATPEVVCARTVRALQSAGIDKVYLSNLGARRAGSRYVRVLEALASL